MSTKYKQNLHYFWWCSCLQGARVYKEQSTVLVFWWCTCPQRVYVYKYKESLQLLYFWWCICLQNVCLYKKTKNKQKKNLNKQSPPLVFCFFLVVVFCLFVVVFFAMSCLKNTKRAHSCSLSLFFSFLSGGGGTIYKRQF